MLRIALRPQWLALLALALGFATAFAALGSWQLDRSRTTQDQRADDDPAVVQRLQDVVRPQEPFTSDLAGVVVQASGRLHAEDTLTVQGRYLDGEPGSWVLTPMVVDTGTGSATLPVVRGWVPRGAPVPGNTASSNTVGTVTVTGRLESSEPPTGQATGDVVTAVSSADLVNRWGQPIYAGFLVADDPGPGVRAVPASAPDTRGFALQNLSYALQWWVFAGFAVFLWWRTVRDAHLRESQPEPDRLRRGVPT